LSTALLNVGSISQLGGPGGEGVIETILVVDDEPRIASFVSRALTAHGFLVDTAADGIQGLRLACERTYDLIVLDLLLPGLDGISVLSRLMEFQPNQPVFVLSALRRRLEGPLPGAGRVRLSLEAVRAGRADRAGSLEAQRPGDSASGPLPYRRRDHP
jgi:CheY-like chemotaxis protein